MDVDPALMYVQLPSDDDTIGNISNELIHSSQHVCKLNKYNILICKCQADISVKLRRRTEWSNALYTRRLVSGQSFIVSIRIENAIT